MFSLKIESNAESVFDSIIRSLQRVEDNAQENLRRAAVDSLAIIAHRIQQQGENAEGSRLRTKAIVRNGAYSKAWAKKRLERGEQIGYMDFSHNGDLFRAWQVTSTSKTEASVGFINNKQADIATGLEEQQGEKVFVLSTSEQDFVLEGWIPRIEDDLQLR
ncbi:hypothetical protein GCM10028808_73040 [Spirosoma migulaei]